MAFDLEQPDEDKLESKAEEAAEHETSDEEAAEILELARKRFKLGLDAESEIRDEARKDLEFYDGEQWDDGAKRRREQDSRPCITINRMKQFVRNVTNEQRQSRPSIKVNPVDDQADIETAKIMSGMIRHIEYDSAADTAYDTAGFHAVSMGRGYLRVITEYADEDSFDQQIKIKKIMDPFAVVIEPDTDDPSWGFIVETLSKDTFKESYPDAKLHDQNGWSLAMQGSDGWVTEDTIRVCEYFYREEFADELLMLADGSTVLKSEYDGSSKIKKRRPTVTKQWKWAKITNDEILELTDWPGRWLPIVDVIGEEYIVEGKRRLYGIVHDAKQAQQTYNFMVSNELELISLMPKAPYIAAEGQIEGYERDWREANLRAVPVLQYKATDVHGNNLPAPQRQNIDPNIGALSTAKAQASEDMKAATGIYDAALGQKSNESSGRAILARQNQSQTANYHYIDNLTRAIRQVGRILIDLIPKIYDTPRVINITGENGEHTLVAINKMFHQENGEPAFYKLDAGRYDVVVTTGPSYATKRQEAVDSFLALAQTAPQLMQIAPDLVIGQMDFPGAEEIAQRFKKMLPPQLQDDAKGDPQAQLAQAASAVQTLQQQLQALNAHAQQVEGELQQLQGKSQTEQMRFQLDQQKLQLDAAKIELDHERFELDKQLAIAKQNLEQQISIAEIDLKQQKLNLEAEVSGKRIALDAIKHDDNTSLAHHENVLKGIQVLSASMPDENSTTSVES